MYKKRIPKNVEKKIKEYVRTLQKDKLPIDRVILFGSYAKGTQHKWSDIDLCVISPRFKNFFDGLEYLTLKTVFDMKYTIEPIGFNPKDFKNKYDSLVKEIKMNGIEIKI